MQIHQFGIAIEFTTCYRRAKHRISTFCLYLIDHSQQVCTIILRTCITILLLHRTIVMSELNNHKVTFLHFGNNLSPQAFADKSARTSAIFGDIPYHNIIAEKLRKILSPTALGKRHSSHFAGQRIGHCFVKNFVGHGGIACHKYVHRPLSG